jgi:hypothetical protein
LPECPHGDVQCGWSEVGAVPHTRKCLTNSKVRHDGTDERDPNLDAYQDIQSQNDYSTAQLNVMGYRGDLLSVQFRPDKIRELLASGPVTVANTRERQEVLAAAHTHGKKFFVTGGEHVTSNDMLIAAELNQRKAEATGREKNKKSRVEYHVRCEAALPIVDRLKNNLENDAGRLKSKELEVLLRWKGVLVSTMQNVTHRRILYQQFAEGGAEEVGIVEIDEAELITLRDGPIAIGDTAYGYGRFEEQKKRDVERAYQMMTAAEKEVFKQKMAEYDETDANDGETPPPTPTPVSLYRGVQYSLY